MRGNGAPTTSPGSESGTIGAAMNLPAQRLLTFLSCGTLHGLLKAECLQPMPVPRPARPHADLATDKLSGEVLLSRRFAAEVPLARSGMMVCGEKG